MIGFATCAQTHMAAPAAAGPKLRVGLLQGNIPQDEKFEGGSGIPLGADREIDDEILDHGWLVPRWGARRAR